MLPQYPQKTAMLFLCPPVILTVACLDNPWPDQQINKLIYELMVAERITFQNFVYESIY